MPVVRLTSLRYTPGSFRVTRSTDALQAAQCIPEISYFSSRMRDLLFLNTPRGYVAFINIYPWGVSVKGRIKSFCHLRNFYETPLTSRVSMV